MTTWRKIKVHNNFWYFPRGSLITARLRRFQSFWLRLARVTRVIIGTRESDARFVRGTVDYNYWQNRTTFGFIRIRWDARRRYRQKRRERHSGPGGQWWYKLGSVFYYHSLGKTRDQTRLSKMALMSWFLNIYCCYYWLSDLNLKFWRKTEEWLKIQVEREHFSWQWMLIFPVSFFVKRMYFVFLLCVRRGVSRVWGV